MRQRGVNAQRLLDVSTRFGEAIIDPAMWPNIMEEVCIVADAAGASLMWPEVALSDFPHTSALADGFRTYIAERWHERNVRAQRIVPLLKRGHTVAIDQDIVRPDEMRRLAFYTEFLMPRGFQWFAVIGVWAESDLWVLSIQRTVRQGPFETNDKLALARISQRLTETASLSRAVGGAALSGISSALCMLKQPVLALDRFGRVLDTNAAAEETFDDEFRVRDRRLSVSDQQAQSMLDTLADQLRITPDNTALPMVPIIVRRSTKPPLCLHVLPIDGVARTPVLGGPSAPACL